MNADTLIRIAARHGVAVDPDALTGPIRGLLSTNPKVEKGIGAGYATAILHLSPSTRSGVQTCASATDGCAQACLNTAGRGGIFAAGENDNAIQRARRRRTHQFFARRYEFMLALDAEIRAHVRRSRAKGLIPAVRLNGTSDIRWEMVLDKDDRNVFQRHPDVVFYDYTKHARRDIGGLDNYSLTFSLAESNDGDARAALASGMNVAAVFRTVPDTFWGLPVLDGDETDLRFLDSPGHIVGLKAKGGAKSDTSGFVR